MDFRRLMGGKDRESADARRAEMARLFALPNRWMARELMALARVVASIVRAKSPGHEQMRLFIEVVPEVAFRLGETEFLPSERPQAVRCLSNASLRGLASSLIYMDHDLRIAAESRMTRGFNAYYLIVNEPCNGNPITVALDRFAPADMADLDSMAESVFRTSELRGHDPVFEWRPDFNSRATPRRLSEAPEVRI